MFELVSKFHPDKIADRIAGAIVDLANTKKEDAIVAVEVLIGHGECLILNETEKAATLTTKEVEAIVHRIAGPDIVVNYREGPQDEHLSDNAHQREDYLPKTGDNGIFKGTPFTQEELELMRIRDMLEEKYPYDGKYLLDKASSTLIVCQSHANTKELQKLLDDTLSYDNIIVNPLGDWTGGTNVDCGATNRKLGSDMGAAVTGGGLHGKDLSKADVSVNIYLSLIAKNEGRPIEGFCAIGSAHVMIDGDEHTRFQSIKERAKNYIKSIGGFEKFAEHGLCR